MNTFRRPVDVAHNELDHFMLIDAGRQLGQGSRFKNTGTTVSGPV
jgi:hypothetical protein